MISYTCSQKVQFRVKYYLCTLQGWNLSSKAWNQYQLSELILYYLWGTHLSWWLSVNLFSSPDNLRPTSCSDWLKKRSWNGCVNPSDRYQKNNIYNPLVAPAGLIIFFLSCKGSNIQDRSSPLDVSVKKKGKYPWKLVETTSQLNWILKRVRVTFWLTWHWRTLPSIA